jgi:TolB protein
VYWLNLASGRQFRLRQDLDGLFFSPYFSPDGKRILLARALKGNTEIWEFRLSSQKLKRLTFHSGIDVSANYSPDQKKIVFNSDRNGSLDIYLMDRNGRNVKRISFGEGNYSSPIWSPRGDLIAFVKQHEGRFFLGVMTPDGENEHIVAENFFIDSPSWAPNGRVLVFHTKTPSKKWHSGRKQLYTVDITGRGLHHLKTPENAAFPSWSPLLN